jgi:serine/threonine-protein kinase HipA
VSAQIDVSLGDVPVALLERDDDGSVRFEFLAGYRRMRARPVLGQWFTDKLDRPLSNELHLPAFFTNLLPEGGLRRLIADSIGARDHEELRLLLRIGEDLPGAVRVQPRGEVVEPAPRELTGKLRFSLAGVQLKFSVAREAKGLTLPASGMGGDWILKLPDRELEGVAENEHMVMLWAERSGIDVPEFCLVTPADCHGIDPRFFPEGTLAFACRRFDRPRPGALHHIEDFAQINGKHPWDKYDDNVAPAQRLNYETLARQILVYCGAEDLREFVRRLVFTVLSGNSDAHLKNWSLIYRDGRTARLSPAYDQVATVAYPGYGDELALPFDGSLDFAAVSLAGFRRLAAALRFHGPIEAWVRDDVARIMAVWDELRPGLPFERSYPLAQHHARLRDAPGSLLAAP